MITYITKGTCSKSINFEVKDNKINHLEFVGGCNGNLKGIAALVKDMDIDTAISKLKGINCGMKNTSCPDQLAQALLEYKMDFK